MISVFEKNAFYYLDSPEKSITFAPRKKAAR